MTTTELPPPPDRQTAPAPAPEESSRKQTSPPLQWAEEPPPKRATWARIAATALVFAVAILAGLVIWTFYVTSPWTRNGRVRVQVANVAPQVSGQITTVRIVDNQFVKKGDVLYVIDPFDYRVKLDSAKASVKQAAADYQVKRLQAERLLNLSDLATSPQQQQQAVSTADMAEGSFQSAQQQQAQAEVNLQRTEVKSPVNGFVTNLLMRVGDYAAAGTSNVSVIDADSYWIDGYFEETKLARICVGDRVEAQLMGYGPPILGQVDTVTRGISVSNATPSTQGLPNVDAVYTWVRLAQRVPVRIRITDVPSGVPLVSGLTATVTVRKGPNGTPEPGPLSRLGENIRAVFSSQPPPANCIPATLGGTGTAVSLPEPTAPPPLAADQVNPGIVPSVTAKPKRP